MYIIVSLDILVSNALWLQDSISMHHFLNKRHIDQQIVNFFSYESEDTFGAFFTNKSICHVVGIPHEKNSQQLPQQDVFCATKLHEKISGTCNQSTLNKLLGLTFSSQERLFMSSSVYVTLSISLPSVFKKRGIHFVSAAEKEQNQVGLPNCLIIAKHLFLLFPNMVGNLEGCAAHDILHLNELFCLP